MSRKLEVLCCGLFLVACNDNSPPAPVAETAEAPTARVSGEDAYLEYCAGCHETGVMDAPVVGDQPDWEHRSQLWQAVLMEHAKTGYFDMPARGSRPDLPDATIEAAAEYMLEITFPDLPPD